MSRRPYPEQWNQLLNVLPKHKWAVMPAAIEVGYSESYASTILPGILAKSQAFQEAIQLKKTEIQEDADWDLKKLQDEYRNLYEQCRKSNDRTNAKGCLDSLTRMLGGFSDKLITTEAESHEVERSKKLSSAQKAILKIYMQQKLDPDGIMSDDDDVSQYVPPSEENVT